MTPEERIENIRKRAENVEAIVSWWREEGNRRSSVEYELGRIIMGLNQLKAELKEFAHLNQIIP